MGFEVTMAIPKKLDDRNRSRLCRIYNCVNCKAIGMAPYPALNRNEENFVDYLTRHFLGMGDDWIAKPIAMDIIREWENGWDT